MSDGKITASGVFEATDVQTTAGASLNGKMDAMTVDGTPTHLSANLVSSGGVFDALAALGLAVSNRVREDRRGDDASKRWCER